MTNVKLIEVKENEAIISTPIGTKTRRIYGKGSDAVIYHKSVRYSLSSLGYASSESANVTEFKPKQSEFSINKRFKFLEEFTTMTINNITTSLVILGEGGLGKSYTVLKQIEKANLVENEDYIIIKGFSTPKALYATLYENSDKIVVFDDCDSVLKNDVSLNILKGALDSYDKRTVSWLSRGFIDDGLPNSFDFTGQIIFISNLPSSKMDGAIKSRSLIVDVEMSLQDKIDRMRAILPEVLPEYSTDLKNEVLNFLNTHKEEASELNMRTLGKVIKIADSIENWEDAAKYILLNS